MGFFPTEPRAPSPGSVTPGTLLPVLHQVRVWAVVYPGGVQGGYVGGGVYPPGYPGRLYREVYPGISPP